MNIEIGISHRIEDMIWWKKIEQFVCATEKGIYTVDHRKSKVQDTLCSTRQLVSTFVWRRIASHIFVDYSVNVGNMGGSNHIGVYSADFQLVRTVDTNSNDYLSCAKSFCVTQQNLVSINIVTQKRRKVLYVNFFDLSMNHLRGVRLGFCNDSVEIRTDGKGHCFVSTGLQRLYIVAIDGTYRTIDLQDRNDCIAIFKNRQIAVSMGRSSIELVTY